MTIQSASAIPCYKLRTQQRGRDYEFDNTTPSIQELIDECREQWAKVGEGVLYLDRGPLGNMNANDLYPPDVLYESKFECVTSLCLTADDGKPCP